MLAEERIRIADVPDLILRTNEIVITEEIVIVTEIVIVEELRIEVVERDNLRVVHGDVLRMVTAEVNFSSATRSKYRATQWQVGEKE